MKRENKEGVVCAVGLALKATVCFGSRTLVFSGWKIPQGQQKLIYLATLT
jgi:hypothetical protein